MSIVNTLEQPTAERPQQKRATAGMQLEQAGGLPHIQDVLKQVRERIAPVWPLKDYVAVNPYAGLAGQKLLSARTYLQTVSDLELLMPLDYYRQQFAERVFCKADIDDSVDEMIADGIAGAERIDANQVVTLLCERPGPSPTADSEFAKANNPGRPFRTFAEMLDDRTGSHWCRLIGDEVSKHCAAHYDQGQAAWSSPWQDLPLYQAWRSAAQHDRSVEILGIAGFRKLVSRLPQQPHAALDALLKRLRVPIALWPDFLLCRALTMPGWSAWTKYQDCEAERRGEEGAEFAGVLAIMLAYEVGLSIQFELDVDWDSVPHRDAPQHLPAGHGTDEELLRYALLKASEIAFRRRLVNRLANTRKPAPGEIASRRSLAQMVFCIDVRSERIRRHLEAASSKIETFGFAGFFGLPIEFVGFGEAQGSSQVPALISPRFKVHEEVDGGDAASHEAARSRRAAFRFLRKAWKDFQSSAASTFAFVETAGLFYGYKLIARSIGLGQAWPSRFDGLARADRQRLAPSLRGLNQQGICTSTQADMAESILRGSGILANFGRLVVFCGHGSQTENNPLKAGLDCGACGGHSGEANARFAARLLNQKYIRQALAGRGIEIPDDTRFVAALHNTTTDQVEFFDTHEVPDSHRDDLEQLGVFTRTASMQTSGERLSVLPGRSSEDLIRRSADWSEVRPEWGLAGNAAFIAAPRDLTKAMSLEGRAFLHSYDYRNDPEFAVLEQIMTAPMIVANWINMQYYASTVDPVHFGSGNKTVHNVVGRFGIFSGNGGDLMTGLPWQSIHDGDTYQHHPLRLLAVIAAPRHAIQAVIARHATVAALVTNGWLQLIAIEDGEYHRYTEQQDWEEMTAGTLQLAAN